MSRTGKEAGGDPALFALRDEQVCASSSLAGSSAVPLRWTANLQGS